MTIADGKINLIMGLQVFDGVNENNGVAPNQGAAVVPAQDVLKDISFRT